MKIILDMVLPLVCGLALFLYGMDLMGDSLKKSAGSKLKEILGKMTSSPAKGFLFGLIVTSIIQSSSATTVMVVGFVNSGTMTLLQSVGVIMERLRDQGIFQEHRNLVWRCSCMSLSKFIKLYS